MVKKNTWKCLKETFYKKGTMYYWRNEWINTEP